MSQVFLGTGMIDPDSGALGGTLSGHLSERECALFRRLLGQRGRTVLQDELERAVWDDGRRDPRRLKVLVQRLRAKVEPDPSAPQFVLTVLRQGYRLAADPTAAEASETDAAARAAANEPPGSPGVGATTLFGREADTETLEDWLLHRHGRWLTLTGVGGVGKSALLHWVWDRARARATPCWWVSLRDVTTTAGVVERVAHAGRITLPPRVPAEPALTAALRAREGLWVLDDLSDLDAEARSALDRLFAPLPRVRVLASGRQPLRSVDEAVLPIAPLSAEAATAMYRSLADDPDAPPPGTVPRLPLWVKLAVTAEASGTSGSLTESELVEAAIARAPAPQALADLGWHPSETNGDFLCSLLGISSETLWAWRRHGLLEMLPEGRVQVHPVIRAALRARAARTDPMGDGRRAQLERLVAYVQGQAARDFEHRPRTVRRNLMDYLDLLRGWAQGLRPSQLDAVFPALPTLERVILGSGQELAWIEVFELLTSRLDRRGEARSAARLRLAITGIEDRISPGAQILARRLEIRRDALAPDDRDLLDLQVALGHLLVGETEAAIPLVEGFEGRVDGLPPTVRAYYDLARAALARRLGRYDEAIQAARAAVERARRAVPLLEPKALLGLTSALQDGGLTEEAWPVLSEAERAAERWDDHGALLTTLRQQAQQAILARQTGRALEHAERALALSYPGSADYAYALSTAAVLHRRSGAWARSLALLDEALTEARQQRLTTLVPVILDGRGNTHVRQGDISSALASYDLALQAALAIGDERDAKRIHSNIAYAHLLAGDPDRALHHQQLGHDLANMHVSWQAFWEWRQAAILAAHLRFGEARTCLLRTLEHAQTLRSIELACESAALAAHWLFEAGDPDGAAAICEAITLTPDDAALMRRLPAPLREAVQRPSEPTLARALDLAHQALRATALLRRIDESGLQSPTNADTLPR